MTLFALAILALLCAVGVAGRYKSFTKLETFHQHVRYASVGVSFDFGPFSEYLTSIVISLEGVRYARMSGYGKATVSRLLASFHGIDRGCQVITGFSRQSLLMTTGFVDSWVLLV